MASFTHLLDQRRLIGPGGSTTSGDIYFYYSGTSVLAPVWQDSGMTIPSPNPIAVGAGEVVPLFYLDDSILYRRVIQYSDGSYDETDALGALLSEGELGLPVGAIIDYAGPTAPDGFLLCYGQEISRTTYSDLFTAIGTQYGAGNGTTTFNVPDFRGRVSAGKDNMGGIASGRLATGISPSASILGGTGGTDTHVLTVAQLPAHSHTITDPGHTHTINDTLRNSGGTANTTGGGVVRADVLTSNSATTGITINNTGSGEGHSSVQPTIISNKIIKTSPTTFLSLVGGLLPNLDNKANAEALGVDPSDVDMGTFTGSTIPDGQTAKEAIQYLETAVEAREPTLAAGVTSQYYRGDKTWQTLNKTAVGLPNVDNTSDANKPISTAQQAALDLKANLASPTFTGTVSGITKSMVGLGNVDNTSDANKPVSTAQQTEFNLRPKIVSNRTNLAALAGSANAAYLVGSGREGLFIWNSANLSAQVTADPGQGVYVAPSTDTTGASGAWVRDFKGPLDPKWFGAIGDGVTSDNTAISNLATYCNYLGSASIALGVGQYRITSQIQFSASITMTGLGPNLSGFVVVGNARPLFNGGTGSTIYSARQFYLKQFRITQSGANTGTSVLAINFDASADSRGTIPGAVLEDIDIRVENTSASWNAAIYHQDVPNIRMARVRIEGARVSPLTCVRGIRHVSTAGAGSGASDPSYEDLSVFFVQEALVPANEVEGMVLKNPLFIACRKGVVWSYGAGTFQPGLRIEGGHMNCEGRNLDLTNISEINLTDVSFYGQGVDGTTTEHYAIAADFSPGVGGRLNLHVRDCMFQGDLNYGEPSARVTQAIRITGSATDVENGNIGGCFFQTYDVGVYLGANVNGITVADDCQFANCTANVTDASTNGSNIVAQRTVNGTHWERKLNDGTILKGGTTTVALDASGNGTIALNSAGNNFPNALMSATVSNGDEGTAGDASFCVRWGSSTTSSLAVAVRPNPGAVTVRFMYQAEGR